MDGEIDFLIQRDLLYEQVASQIEKLIASEALRVNDRLPSERVLAERLGVSRPVVREAIRVLSSRGLVEVLPGSGTYIRGFTAEVASKSFKHYLKFKDHLSTFEKLHEIRCTLEVEIAGFAAERATEEDIQCLEAALKGQEIHSENQDEFTSYDLQFHAALAAATYNELYEMMLAPISDLLLEFRQAAYRFNKEGAVTGALLHHQNLLEKIKQKDSEGARQVMRAHLKQAEDTYQAEFQSHSNGDKPTGQD